MISVLRGRLEAAEVANIEVSVIFADKFQGIDSLGVEVVEIHFISWDDFEAVDFLEVEAFKVLFLLVDALKDVAISPVVVNNLRPPSPWRSRP